LSISKIVKNKLTEKKIWQRLNLVQKKLDRCFFTKIESPTINGIPDVYCIFDGVSFWLELKANQAKNLNISKYQIAWHLKYKASGGKSFILNWPVTHEPPKLYEIREPGIPVPVPTPTIEKKILKVISLL
tara:strand:+ start:2394 stop:2783 length:390 start_codon:yes stop_codon:yes gene_type:complete